jgi:hypothetical protein
MTFAAAFAQQTPLDQLSAAIIEGKVPRNRKYRSVFVTNVSNRVDYRVIRATLKRASVHPNKILHISWIGSILHLVTFDDFAEELCRILSEKLNFTSSYVIDVNVDALKQHLQKQSEIASRISVKGFLKRRHSELSSEQLSEVPIDNLQ